MKCPDCGSTMESFAHEKEYECDGYWCDECRRLWCDDEIPGSVYERDPSDDNDDERAEIRNTARNRFSEAMRRR